MVWLGTWREEGHRRAKTLGKVSSMTKAEAEAALDQHVRPVNEARGSVEYTLQGFFRHVVAPWYRRSWKHSTAMTTEQRVDHHLLKELGNKPLTALNRTVLQDFLDKKATERRKPSKDGTPGPLLSHSTLAHLRWDLRQIFRMAVNDGLLARNPAELLHIPKGTRSEKRVLSAAQLTMIINVLDLRERLIVKLAGICGMRPGEIVGLQWGDVQPDGLRITRGIYRGIIQTPKTHHSVRTAALPTSVREDLSAWRSVSPNTSPDAWVFPSENSNTPLWANNAWYDKIRPVIDKLGMAWVNHQTLRRTAVTLLNANGADGTIVAAQLGHTVDVSTNVYNKVGIQRQQHAVQQLDDALTPKSLQRAS
jgi:integrase